MLAILTCVKGHIIVVLICASLDLSTVEHLPCACGPSYLESELVQQPLCIWCLPSSAYFLRVIIVV